MITITSGSYNSQGTGNRVGAHDRKIKCTLIDGFTDENDKQCVVEAIVKAFGHELMDSKLGGRVATIYSHDCAFIPVNPSISLQDICLALENEGIECKIENVEQTPGMKR